MSENAEMAEMALRNWLAAERNAVELDECSPKSWWHAKRADEARAKALRLWRAFAEAAATK